MKKMKITATGIAAALCMMLIPYISATVLASDIEVKLRAIPCEYTVKDLLLITETTNRYELPTPPFQLGESRTNLAQKIASFEKCETVVAATIEDVIPIAITGLQNLSNWGTRDPLFWYRIKCKVNDVVKGDFPHASMEFVATYGGDRLFWQFVRGYAFYWGLVKHEDGWMIKEYHRTSPFPPYKMEDHIWYHEMKRNNPDFDWSQPDAVIKQAEDKVGRWCRDAAIEKQKYLIMTFQGDELWGNLQYDYGKSVTILTNKWNFPFPDPLIR